MFNQAIYSEKKISRTVDIFSELLDRIMRAENPGQIRISELANVNISL